MQIAQLSAKHSAQLVVMQAAYSSNMNDEESPERPYRLTRRLKLGQLVREAGGASELGRLCDTPKSHISAMLSGARNVGDDLATKLERKMDKPLGWMDFTESTPETDARIDGILAGNTETGIGESIISLSKFLARLEGLPREVATASIKYLLEAPADVQRVFQVQQQLEQYKVVDQAKKDAA